MTLWLGQMLDSLALILDHNQVLLSHGEDPLLLGDRPGRLSHALTRLRQSSMQRLWLGR